MLITPCKYVRGEIVVPGDKSISHRAIMLGAIADGVTEIENFLIAEDCMCTVDCFKKMGVAIAHDPSASSPPSMPRTSPPTPLLKGEGNKPVTIKVYGNGLCGLAQAKEVLDAGNSGTTARLIMGILAGQDFNSIIDGDASLRKRPMQRIIEPLSQMGGLFSKSNFLPITLSGGNLKGIKYNSPISSAQIKSSVLLASLYANSETHYTEPVLSRNHTELMLSYFGANLKIKGNSIASTPISKLNSQHIIIPGDISSAAFFITLGLILPNSQITIKNAGINHTRTGILDVYKQMGGNIKIDNPRKINNEMIGDITITSSNLAGIEIGGSIIPRLIDEIPAIVIAATQASGTTIIKDASELKVKESNRINSIVAELSKMGADIAETPDGIIINGPTQLRGRTVQSHNDHRIAMALAIAGKIAVGETIIENSGCVNISFPGFFELLNKVTVYL